MTILNIIPLPGVLRYAFIVEIPFDECPISDLAIAQAKEGWAEFGQSCGAVATFIAFGGSVTVIDEHDRPPFDELERNLRAMREHAATAPRDDSGRWTPPAEYPPAQLTPVVRDGEDWISEQHFHEWMMHPSRDLLQRGNMHTCKHTYGDGTQCDDRWFGVSAPYGAIGMRLYRKPEPAPLVEQLSADVNDEIPTFEEHIHEWELISTHDSGDHFRCKLIWPSTGEHCDEMFFIVAGNTFGPPEGLLGRRIITRSDGKTTAQTVPTCAHGNRRHPGSCIPTATTEPRQDSHLGRDTGSEDV